MQTYDGWELLRDENDPQRERMLGKGGQGEVYLARSPERAVKRGTAENTVRVNLVQVGGGRWNTKELAQCLVELGSPDPPESLGALKKFIIPPDNKDEEAKALRRLESEAKALKALQGHPGILQLRHANVADRFIVTEYHARGTLNKHLELYRGEPLKALEAFEPLVEAVCRIHDEGAIHRDIKTENIFVTSDGKLVLGDFGIVFFRPGGDRLTETYERVGSHEWMAPWAYQRRRLDLDRVNPTLDIFPLTKVLWAMIAGEGALLYWEYERPENNLENLFPNDPIMSLINKRVFANRIVRDENQCNGSAKSLLADVRDLIAQLKISPGFRPDRANAWSCAVCGKGRYQAIGVQHQLKAIRQGGPAEEQQIVLYVYLCDRCGHAELFKQ
jgi:serine/threonine protein kinase